MIGEGGGGLTEVKRLTDQKYLNVIAYDWMYFSGKNLYVVNI